MMLSEREQYDRMPMLAIIELPKKIVFEYNHYLSRSSAIDFGIEDMIDSCLACMVCADEAQDNIAEWMNEIVLIVDEEEGDKRHPESELLLRAMGELFTKVHETCEVLYTPTGFHYFEFSGWLDSHTLILAKRSFGD